MDPLCISALIGTATAIFSSAPIHISYGYSLWQKLKRWFRKSKCKCIRYSRDQYGAPEIFYRLSMYLTIIDKQIRNLPFVEHEAFNFDIDNANVDERLPIALPECSTVFEIQYKKNNNTKIIKIYANMGNNSKIMNFEVEVLNEDLDLLHNFMKPIYIDSNYELEYIMNTLYEAQYTDQERDYVRTMRQKRNELYKARNTYITNRRNDKLIKIDNVIKQINERSN